MEKVDSQTDMSESNVSRGIPRPEAREGEETPGQGQIYSAWYPSGSSEDGLFPVNLDSNASSSALADADTMKLLAASARNISRLMRKTRGRMRGHIHFRKRPSHPWQSAYCITGKNGTLRRGYEDEDAILETLVRDLRGCQVCVVSENFSSTPILHIRSATSPDEVQIKLRDTKHFEYWFAALLCWKASNTSTNLHREIGIRRPTKVTPFAQDHVFMDRRLSTVHSSTAVLLDNLRPSPSDNGRSYDPAMRRHSSSSSQTEVLCTLRGNGELLLQLLAGDQPSLVTLSLGKFPRSAIQQIKKSVFNKDHVLAIFPQYALSSEACSRVRPVFLCYETMESFETWMVLLQAFAGQEAFCPQQVKTDASHARLQSINKFGPASMPSYLRTQSSLRVSIGRARIFQAESLRLETGHYQKRGPEQSAQTQKSHQEAGNYVAHVLVDERVKATSSFSWEGTDPTWHENFYIRDLSGMASTVSIRIEQRDDKRVSSTRAPFCGQTDILLDDLAESPDNERWWPILDYVGHVIGEISLNISISRENILASREYEGLLKLVRNTRNRLTLKIWRQVPSELSALVEHLLDIFEGSGLVVEWLKDLVAEEIENARPQRENNNLKSENDKYASTDQNASSLPEPEIAMQRAAAADVSVLFRGNTLLTKALESHIKRIGGNYLEATVAEHVRRIISDEKNCEVDPAKMPHATEEDLKRNWENLRSATNGAWRSIYKSASTCPIELKEIMQHIRSCAKSRFGDSAPNVIYSSVSGFLFLRFFCAALMNPHLFGLIPGRPPPLAQRTFLLVAKSIQGLANLSSFGTKELWMSPMNDFYQTHRQELMNFIDSICTPVDNSDLSKEQRSSGFKDPSGYEVPLNIYKSLPPVAREGFLSLPHLIDRPRSLAALVELWMTHFERTWSRGQDEAAKYSIASKDSTQMSKQTVTLKTLTSILGDAGDDEDLAAFHAICRSLHQRTAEIVQQVEMEAMPTEEGHEFDIQEAPCLAGLDGKWVKLAERLEFAPEEFHLSRVSPVPPSPVTTSFLDDSTASSPIVPNFKDGELEPSKEVERAASASEGKRRSYRRSNVAALDRRSRRASSPSMASDAHSRGSDKESPRSRKKRPPSPPGRGAEENALRKLGWI